MTKKYYLILFLSLSLAACSKSTEMPINQEKLDINVKNEKSEFTPDTKILNIPITNALARITKKPFGIKISPKNSPVQPEKFFGFHTGVDFEIFTSEQEIPVKIFAICNGQIILKQHVNGYGGVLVQNCNINKTEVTVIYGHLNLNSISAHFDDNLRYGELIGTLGQGFSQETDDERKHLHLAIHKGNEINLRGYVDSPDLLSQWLDPVLVLNLEKIKK